MSLLDIYRDDGPLARAIAGAIKVPGTQTLLTAVAVVPLFVLIAAEGAHASRAAAGTTLAWLVVVAAVAGRAPTDRLRWAVPP
ncbi:MAG: hypothetical protein QOE38_2374, partial [Thermoleophilaceae bacterium]|nr:hypothetical protein [Thermoleophilaceae bacterium]